MKNKYFIAIVPPEPLRTQVMELKHEVEQRFGSKCALRSPAHITLHMPFELEGKKEERFLEAFTLFQPAIEPFMIKMTGFSFFPPRVVFVDVANSESLMRLQRQVVDYMKMFYVFNQSEDTRGFHPHMTIAFRDLKKAQFNNARDYYSQKQFSAAFICNAVTLLKHSGEKWNELMHVPLSD